MSQRHALTLTCALIATVGAGTMNLGITEESALAAQGPETFLGFRLGEEIRYTLERADGERSGMHAVWGIRLEEFDRETGVFALTHESALIGGSSGSGQGGTLLSLTTATAWINAYGSPDRVLFTTQRNTPMGGIEYTVEYRHENDRFIKELVEGGKDQEVKLDDFGTIDPETASGVYLFMPVDAECVAVARAMAGNRLGGSPPGGSTGGASAGGAGGGGPGRGGNMEEPCRGREPIFANPGLLNLTMPALWEAGTGTLELLALAPTGVRASVLLGPANRGGGTGFSVGGYSLLGGSGPNPFGDAEDAFQLFGLAAEGDMMQLDVGGRSVDVWRLRATPPLESAYVDGYGSIVRLDLPADTETGERFWIRRLRPNEY